MKFTPSGGSVTLSCVTTETLIHLLVQDTGVGIPRDRVSEIFEPFVQLDRSLVNPREGVGLGLAISRDLSRGMDGDLTVTSEVGTGSTFTLSLQRAAQSADAE